MVSGLTTLKQEKMYRRKIIRNVFKISIKCLGMEDGRLTEAKKQRLFRPNHNKIQLIFLLPCLGVELSAWVLSNLSWHCPCLISVSSLIRLKKAASSLTDRRINSASSSSSYWFIVFCSLTAGFQPGLLCILQVN